eukprot:m.487826 g.487826  ORF g.487826 m.487826 type:complete len:358 (-) comp25274_c0_seq1:31-1104(-)
MADAYERKKRELEDLEGKLRELTGRDPNERRPMTNKRERGGAHDRDGPARRVGGRGFGDRGRDGDGDATKRRRWSSDGVEPTAGGGGRDHDARLRSVAITARDDGGRRRSRGDDAADDAGRKRASVGVISDDKASTERRRRLSSDDNPKNQARAKRMFGRMLMGTLQSAQKSAERKSATETKYMEIEKKVEEQTQKEREELAAKRKELYEKRREARLELFKLQEEHEASTLADDWKRQKELMTNFIWVKSSPRLFWLPAKHTKETRQLLAESMEDQLAHHQRVAEELKQQQAELEARGEDGDAEAGHDLEAKDGNQGGTDDADTVVADTADTAADDGQGKDKADSQEGSDKEHKPDA